jgi:hypothetical protein
MEPTAAFASGTDHASLPDYRPRHVPDVPEDVDFLLEHLNDPNLDLKNAYAMRSQGGFNKPAKSLYDKSDYDTESHYDSDRYSTSRADSRNSTAIDFEECVLPLLTPRSIIHFLHSSESPYPEVRAAVSTVDDPFMPVNTIRM